MQIADQYCQNGELSKALEKYKEIVEKFPCNYEAWMNLGHCFFIMKDYHSSLSAYQKVQKSNTQEINPQLWYALGLVYIKLGSYYESKHCLSFALKISPNFQLKQKLLYKLGMVYLKLNRKQKAKHYLSLSISDEEDRETFKNAAAALFDLSIKKGKLEELYPLLKKAVSLHRDAHILSCMGVYFLGRKDYNRAEETLNEALKLVEKDSSEAGDIYYLLSIVNTGNLKKSFTYIQKALSIRSEYSYWIALGILYFENSQFKESFQSFMKANSLRLEGYEAYHNLGVLYSKTNQPEYSSSAHIRSAYLNPRKAPHKELMVQVQLNYHTFPFTQSEDLQRLYIPQTKTINN